jgi:hypothetical protein
MRRRKVNSSVEVGVDYLIKSAEIDIRPGERDRIEMPDGTLF